MQELKDLINIAFSDRIKKIELLNGEDINRKSLPFRLADGIHKGKFATDEEAAKSLLDKNASDSAYKMLKKRLKDKLYTTLLFMQSKNPEPNSYHHQAYECYKQMAVAKMLVSIGIDKTAERMLNKIIQKSKPIELYELIEQAAIILRRFTMQGGDYVRFKEFGEIFKDANKKIAAEAKAEELHFDIVMNFSHSLVPEAEIIEKLEKYKSKMNKLKDKHSTFNVNYYYFQFTIAYYQLMKQYDKSLETSIELEDFIINSGVFYNTVRHANVLLVKLDASLLAKNYNVGHESATKALQFYRKGSFNWYKTQEYHFLLCLNTANLESAVSAFREVNSDSGFAQLHENQKELWKVYGGYLWFLLLYSNKNAQYSDLLGEGHSFRMSSLINDIPHYSKDTKGIKVAVLILQLLFFLQQKEFIEITKRIEALRVYLYRYLSVEEAYRSHYFIKMLMLIERYNFDPEKSHKMAARFLWKLLEANLQYTPTQTQIEIVPYEDLWNIVLNILRQQNKKGV